MDTNAQPQTVTDYLVNRSNAVLEQGNLRAEEAWLNSGTHNNTFALVSPTGRMVDDAVTRRMGLEAYVTQDMSEKSAQLSRTLFGKTNPDNNSETAYTFVGRALASSHNLARNPQQFFALYGKEYDLTMPSDWDSDLQLYASIGQQYTQKKRAEMQQHQAEEAARLKILDEEKAAEADEGLSRYFAGKDYTLKQWQGMKDKYGLDDSGLSATLTRAKTAYELYRYGRGRDWAKALEEVDAAKKRAQEAEAAMVEPHDLSQAEGLLEKGNIDPYTRKVERRADGSIATVESFSVNLDGKEVLLPGVIDGKKVSEEAAIEHYRKTGEHLGIFDTPENATAYAQKFHENQAAIYGREERRAELNQALADGGLARLKAIGGAALAVTPLLKSERVIQKQIAGQLAQDPIAEQIFYDAIIPIAKQKAKHRNALADVAQGFENIVQDTFGRPGDIMQDIFADNGRKWYDNIPFVSRSYAASIEEGIIANIESIDQDAFEKRKTDSYSTGNSIIDNVTSGVGTGIRALGSAAPYMAKNPIVAIAAFSDYAKRQRSEYQNRYYIKTGNAFVRSNNGSINWWEENGLPVMRAAGTVGGYKAVGALNLQFGKAAAPLFERWGATSIGNIAARALTSRAGAFAAGLTESAAVLEEISLVDNTIQRLLDVAGVPFGVEDKREGLQGFRQMRQDLAEAWGTPGKLMRGEQVQNWNFIAGAVAFGIGGVSGRLKRNAAESSFWNTLKVSNEQQRYIKSSRTPEERSERFSEILQQKMRENPEACFDTLVKAGADLASKESVMQLVRDNYGQKIIELSGGKASRREDGNYDIELKLTDKEGNERTESHTWTEEQFGTYIAEHYNRDAISALTEIQSRVRGERLTRAAENRDPWLRLVTLDGFDADIAKTLKDGQITEKTIRALAESCRRRIAEWTQRYTTENRTPEEARRMAEQQTVGNTGVTLGSLANIDTDFAARETYARATGELGEGENAAARAFLASRGLGEVTMAFVRGEVTEADVLHELIEARTRTLMEQNTDAVQAMKEALIRINNDLKNNITGKDSLLPPGKTAETITATDIIEAMSHLAEADFLTFHDALDLATETHAALEAAKEHLQDLQSITALSDAWKAYTKTEAGQNALTDNNALLQDILEQSRAYVRDVYADAEKESMDAARAIIDGHDTARAAERDALLRRAAEDEKPLTPEQEAAQPENPLHYGPTEAKDSITGTRLSEDTFKTPLDTDPETGEMAPRPGTERVTEPEGAGRGLAGGVADKLPNGHVIGAAKRSDLTTHAVLATKRAKQNIDALDAAEAPVLCIRAADGTLRAIDNLGKLIQAERDGGTYVEVEVVDESADFTAAHARRTEQEYAIRMRCASAANILRHIEEHGLTRADAVERGLVTLDTTGQETAASAIAWKLRDQGSADLRRSLLEGKLTTKDAARICDIAPGNADLQAAVMKWRADGRNMRWNTIEKRVKQYREEQAKQPKLSDFRTQEGTYQIGDTTIVPPSTFVLTAYHASPHDFRKFSTDFMGTGEGSQQYGWGVYLARNTKVAEAYSRSLVRQKREIKNEAAYNADKEALIRSAETLLPYSEKETLKKAIDKLPITTGEIVYRLDYYRNESKRIENDIKNGQPGARTADLQEQKTMVALLEEALKLQNHFVTTVEKTMVYKTKVNVTPEQLVPWFGDIPDKLKKQMRWELGIEEFVYGYDHGNWYQEITRKLGSPKAASMWLKSMGWKGIKETDGLSRLKKEAEQTYNIIIFDANDIKITDVLNRKEFTLNEAEWESYTDTTASFGMTGYRERLSLHDLLREQRVSDLIARADRIAFVGRSVLGGKTVDERAVNRLIGQLIGTHRAIEQEFANNPYARAEMMDKMKQVGSRLRAMRDLMAGKFDTADVKALGEEENAKISQAVGRGAKVNYVTEYLRDYEGDLLRSAARIIEDEEIDAYMRELDALIAANAPDLKASGRTERARNSLLAAEKAARIRTLMELPRYEVDRHIDDLNAQITAAKGEKDGGEADETHVNALQNELNEWMTYGALRERGLDAVRKGASQLRQYLATEKQKWQERRNAENAIITANRDAIKEAVPVLDTAKLGNEKLDKEASFLKGAWEAISNSASLDDLLIRMSNIKGVGSVAKRWQIAAARKRSQYAVTLHSDICQEHTWLAETLGLRTDSARAQWLEDCTTINKTDISTEGTLKTDIGNLALQEAHRIVNLTPEERQRERNHNHNKLADGQPYPDEAAVATLKTRIAKRSYVDGTISFANYGDKRDTSVRNMSMRLSRMQAANLVLLAEQPSYRDQLNAAGYTADIVGQLRDYAGKDVMAYSHWCRDYLKNIGTKEVFEQREGVPFPAEENYWPGHFMHSDVSNTASSFITGAMAGRGIYTFLITRRLHNIQPDTTLGVNEVFRTAIQAHRRYQAMGDLTNEMRRTFADSVTSGRMRAIMGDTDFNRLKAAIPILDASYAVDAAACRAERRAMARLMTSSVMTFLPGSVKPIFYSLASLLTGRAAEGMGTRRYAAEAAKQTAIGSYHGLESTVKHMLRIKSDDPTLPMNPRKILELDAFKARHYNDGLYNRLINQPQNTKFSRMEQIANTALSAIGETDIWANSVSMSILYNKTYADLTERFPDMSDAIKRRHCEDAVESTLRLAAQPIDPADKAIRYSTNTDPLAMWIWNMKSDVLKALSVAKTMAEKRIATPHYLRAEDGLAAAARRTGIRLKEGYSYLAPISLLLQGINIGYQGVIANIPSPSEDPEGFRSWLIQQGIVGVTLGSVIDSLPFIGTAYRGAYNSITGLLDEEDRGTTMAAGRTTFTSFDTAGLYYFMRDINTILADEKDWDEKSWVNLTDAIRAVTSWTDTITPRNSATGATIRGTVNAVNTANNFIRPLLQRSANTANDD